MPSQLAKLPLGKRIRALRRAKDLTQTYLADCLDVSRPTIAHIEAGTVKVDSERLRKIADALGVSLDELCPSPRAHAKNGRLCAKAS